MVSNGKSKISNFRNYLYNVKVTTFVQAATFLCCASMLMFCINRLVTPHHNSQALTLFS